MKGEPMGNIVLLHEVTLTLCALCIAGEGGECHTPGCALYMSQAPDIPIHITPPPTSTPRS